MDEIEICQVNPLTSLCVDLVVNNVTIGAVVDTAAQVSIISDDLFNSLKPVPKILGRVKMHTAGKDLSMTGFRVGPVGISLEATKYVQNLYVAPIENPMLLGLDFMRTHGIKIDVPSGSKDTPCLVINGQKLKLQYKQNRELSISDVVVAKKKQ